MGLWGFGLAGGSLCVMRVMPHEWAEHVHKVPHEWA